MGQCTGSRKARQERARTPRRCRRICWLRVSVLASRLPLLAREVRALRSPVGGRADGSCADGSLSKLDVAARRGPRLLRLVGSLQQPEQLKSWLVLSPAPPWTIWEAQSG